jgi:hypothetical protein
LTPWVLRPEARTDLVSMRMILPNWLMTMSSLVSSTRLLLETLPTLEVAFHIDDALAAAELEAVPVDIGARLP